MRLRAYPRSVTPPPERLLLVHQDNLRAIRFYERCGFMRIPDVVRRNNHAVMKLWVGETT